MELLLESKSIVCIKIYCNKSIKEERLISLFFYIYYLNEKYYGGNNVVDTEKILLGLKHCVEDNCIGCPYQNAIRDCLKDLHTDISTYIEKFNHKTKN